MTLRHEDAAGRDAQRAHVRGAHAVQQLEQMLAHERMAAQGQPVGLPAHRQARRAQRGHPLAGIRDAERRRALGVDLLEQRGADEEVPVLPRKL